MRFGLVCDLSHRLNKIVSQPAEDFTGDVGGDDLPELAGLLAVAAERDVAAQAFASDLSDGSASPGDVSGIRSTAAAIRSDAQGVAASPGPRCVPGLRANLAAAAGDYSRAAADAENGMSQYTAGNTNDAASDINAASSAIGSGNARLARATAAVSRYKAD